MLCTDWKERDEVSPCLREWEERHTGQNRTLSSASTRKMGRVQKGQRDKGGISIHCTEHESNKPHILQARQPAISTSNLPPNTSCMLTYIHTYKDTSYQQRSQCDPKTTEKISCYRGNRSCLPHLLAVRKKHVVPSPASGRQYATHDGNSSTTFSSLTHTPLCSH